MSIFRFTNKNQGKPRDFFRGGSGTVPQTQWRMRQDTEAAREQCLLADGEPFWVVDDDAEFDGRFYIGDGETLGGIEIGGSGAAAYKVKVSADDTTGDYLSSKITAGDNVTLIVNNDGMDEEIEISVAVPDVDGFVEGPGDGVNDSTDMALMRWDGTTGRLAQNSGAILDDNNNLTLPGRVGIYGADVDATKTFNVSETFLHTTGNRYGVDVAGVHAAASAGDGNVTAIRGQTTWITATGAQTGTMTGVEGTVLSGDADGQGSIRGVYGKARVTTGTASAYGVQGTAEWNSSSSGTLIGAGLFQVDAQSAATIAESRGVTGIVTLNGAGTLDRAVGGHFGVFRNAGTVTDAIGVFIANDGTATNNIPLQIGEGGGGINCWNLKVPSLAADWTWTVPTTDGNAYETLMTDGSGVTSWSAKVYDFRGFYPILNDALICDVWRTPRAYTMADDFAGSYATAEVGATSDAVFTVYKATGTGAFSSIGTITFANGGSGGRQAGTFATSGGAVSMAAGDCLKVVAPATADATLVNVSIVFAGTLAQ